MKKWSISFALKISLIYAFIGYLWILLSDRIVAMFFIDTTRLLAVQTYKGWFFIASTALILFILIKNEKRTLKIAENSLIEADNRYRMLVENLPAVVFMDDFDTQKTYYMSPRIENLLGYTPEEWEKSDNLWEDSLHPDDKERVIAEDIRTNKNSKPFRIEYRLRHRNGHYVWIKEDASIIRGEDGTPLFWQGVLLDITGPKQIEESLKRHDAILKAAGFSAEQFLKSNNWEDCINLVLEELGKATEVSRVYIFKKQLSTDNIVTVSQVAEWCKSGAESQMDNQNLQNKDFAADGFSRWIELFDKDMPVHGFINSFPETERNFLAEQGILSIICIPLQVGRNWWGFIGFDECTREREWSETEMEVLKAAANTLSTAIEKKLAEKALLNSETSYRGLFNSIHDAIFIQDINGVFLDVNDGAVHIYGYPKEFFVGKTPAALGAPDKNDTAEVMRFIQYAFNGEAQQFEFWGKRSSGEVFPADVRLFKGTYFGQDVAIAVTQDITARKRGEDETQKQLKELTVLHAVALAESTSKTMDELLQRVTDIIGDMLYPDTCGILLLNETRGMLKPHFSYRGTSDKDMSLYLPLTTGITGKVAATGQTIRIGDVSRESTYHEAADGIRSELCVPISNGTTIIGVLNVESREPDAFTTNDERLLTTTAGGMARTIERIQLFELEQKRRKQAEILSEATGELNSLFEAERLFENIFTSLAKLIGYDSASIETLNQGYFEIIAGQNIPKELIGKKYETDLEKWGGLRNLRRPFIIPDVRQDERFTKFDETDYIRSWMGIPLFVTDRIIGFLNLDSRTPGFFSEEHASIGQTFANQIAIAMENARLFELEHHRRRQAEILSQATSALANTLDINDLFENILDWLQKIAPYDSASIMLQSGDMEKFVAIRNLPGNFQVGQTIPMTKKWKEVAESRRPYIADDAQQSEYFEKWEDTFYIRGWMCIAMYLQDKLIGFINLDSKTPGAFTAEHGVLVQTFGNQAATAIENARLFELEQKRRKNAEVTRQAATILTNLLDLPSLHEAILEWLHRITPYDSASILELEGDHLRITAARGLPNPKKALDQAFQTDNLLCRVMNETLEPLIIEDCNEDPRFEKWGDTMNVRGWMGVPMVARGQVIGYITLDSHTPNAYTQSDAIAAQTFAHQAATSLENSRLFIETKQRLEELEVVSRISFSLRAAHDTQEMLPILLDEIKTSINTESAAIWLYDIEKNELISMATSGWFENLPKPNFKPREGIVGMAYSNGITHVSYNADEDSSTRLENVKFFGENRSGIVVPIRTATEIIGALAVTVDAPRKVKPHQTRLVTTLAEIAGNAIYRSNLYQRSEEQIQRLTTLRELDTAIASSLDLRITLSILTEHLLTKMGVSATAVLVFKPESRTFDYYAATGFKNREGFQTPLHLGDGMAGQILLSRRALYIKELNEETTPIPFKQLKSEQFRSYYAVPLFSKGATRGILETYFRQPFSPSADWIEFIHTLAEQAAIAIDNTQLFENLQHTNQELSLAYDTTLEGWGKALELRDKETQGHTNRVTDLTLELARQMGIPESELLQIRRGCLLHDIGKMGVPDNILRKNGSLTEEEKIEMRKHPQYAYEMLYPIEYLRPALDIAYCHHEWWDGNGYPRGLKGEDIPLSARIFAVVDVWDALSSDRPYRKAWERGKIIEYIRDLSGRQFDSHVVEAFFRMMENETRLFN